MPSTTEDIVTSPTAGTELGGTEAVVDGATTTTTEAPWDGPTMPLTGEPAPTGLPERPALVVKGGNNDGRSLPQVGLEVAALRRIRIGRIPLGKLPPGSWRFLPVGERF